MREFLAKYFIEQGKKREQYLSLYRSLLQMIQETSGKGIFSPSVEIFGNENIDVPRESALNRLDVAIGHAKPFVLPINYYPERSKLSGRTHPVFNMADSTFFRENGDVSMCED
jgi:hypothetical protein